MRAYKVVFALAVIAGIIAVFVHILHGVNFPIFNPKGQVGLQERNMLIFTVSLSLIIVVPVFIMLFLIVWRYRESNTKAKYTPDWDHSRILEGIWWGIPCLIIIILGVTTWISTHQLDPSKALVSSNKPITVQVVALQWKWLFIYPEQHVASVNALEIPVDTPIDFEITADAPMNSFWIPSLGGQIYAMPGMSTHLNLIANSVGNYDGSSANLSGSGFSGMKFVVKAASKKDYLSWVASVQHSRATLDQAAYTKLSLPTSDVTPAYYTLNDAYLYDKIVQKYMSPGAQ